MKRVNLYTIINNIIPTYSIGQIKGIIKSDLAILRRGLDTPSLSNSLGHWDTWSIDIYSPTSPSRVDDIVNQIKNVLDSECEIEILRSGDYFDEVLHAFSTTITIRTPNIY